MHTLIKRVEGNLETWMMRAFAYGASGRVAKKAGIDYQWPKPPDCAWQLVVCCYSEGECDLDFLHPVSRKFWSEDNGFFESPPGKRFSRQWYEKMGFSIVEMSPFSVAIDCSPSRHLALTVKVR